MTAYFGNVSFKFFYPNLHKNDQNAALSTLLINSLRLSKKRGCNDPAQWLLMMCFYWSLACFYSLETTPGTETILNLQSTLRQKYPNVLQRPPDVMHEWLRVCEVFLPTFCEPVFIPPVEDA